MQTSSKIDHELLNVVCIFFRSIFPWVICLMRNNPLRCLSPKQTLQHFLNFEFVTMFLETLCNKKALYVNHTILFLPGKGTENWSWSKWSCHGTLGEPITTVPERDLTGHGSALRIFFSISPLWQPSREALRSSSFTRWLILTLILWANSPGSGFPLTGEASGVIRRFCGSTKIAKILLGFGTKTMNLVM